MKLPSKLYIRSEGKGDEHYFQVETNVKDHGGEVGETRKVGIYKLEKTITITTEITTTEK